jgi:hypothetical protein
LRKESETTILIFKGKYPMAERPPETGLFITAAPAMRGTLFHYPYLTQAFPASCSKAGTGI